MKPMSFDQAAYGSYALARRLDPEAAVRLAKVIRPYLDGGSGPMLDLGAGTGRFVPMIERELGLRCVAAEPSAQMRANRPASAATASWVAARAECLPFLSRSFSCAFMSMALHHVDLAACGAELDRVLGRPGLVILRNSFADRPFGFPAYAWFPAARDADSRRLPTVGQTLAAFAAFPVSRLVTMHEPVAANLADFERRLSTRAYSFFEHLGRDEIDEGFARLRSAVASEVANRASAPVFADIDVLILRR